jgi:hypothetical protein
MPGYYLTIGHDCFLPSPSNLLIEAIHLYNLMLSSEFDTVLLNNIQPNMTGTAVIVVDHRFHL